MSHPAIARSGGPAETRTFTLFGRGISYSASPAIHAAALAALGLPHRYVISEPEDFAAAVHAMRGGSGGANVTIPFKTEAVALVDELSNDAAELGAVNTIVVEGERLIGHNTDLPATLQEITALLNSREGPERAVIMGAGGASRAVQVALERLGIPLRIAQRRDGTLQRIDQLLADATLLVNTTPVGTASSELPLAPELLREDLAVYDLIYRPSPTALVTAARATGAPARDGGGMLVGQAWRSLALWLAADRVEVSPAIAPVLTAALARELGAAQSQADVPEQLKTPRSTDV